MAKQRRLAEYFVQIAGPHAVGQGGARRSCELAALASVLQERRIRAAWDHAGTLPRPGQSGHGVPALPHHLGGGTLLPMADDEKLANKVCVPCRGGVPPLTPDERAPLLAQLDGWEVVDGHHLRKDFQFKDFLAALDFVNRAGAIAEEQNHHPEITLGWGHALVQIWTHKIDGLTESDFVLAAKYDQLV